MSTETTLKPSGDDKKAKIQSILQQLEGFVFPHFLPADSPRQLELMGRPTPKEEKLIEKIKKTKTKIGEEITFDALSLKLQKTKPQELTGITELDIKTLAFLIRKFEKIFAEKTSGKGQELFDEQILALIRAIESYRDPKKRGLVLEMKTGTGKSCVVVPLLIAYLAANGENLAVQEINPYLLEEAYKTFYDFAQKLGIQEKVGKLETYLEEEAMQKQIVFGYWPNFIHHQQERFLRGEIEGEKPRIMILDELDQILNEEAIVPAVISERMINPDEFFKAYFQNLKHEYELYPESVMLDFSGYKITFCPKDLIPEDAEEFKENIKAFFMIMQKELEVKKQQAQQGLTKLLTNPDNREQVRDFLMKNLPFWLFKFLVYYQFSEQFKRETPLSDEEIYKIIDKIINERVIENFKLASNQPKYFPWWEDPEFQYHLINAFLLQKGVDYEVIEEEIRPLAPMTGYSEKSKQFPTFTNLLLYLKEGLEFPPQVLGPEVDKQSILAFYVGQLEKGGKIFGFTGTVAPVAKRLDKVYGLETTLIPTPPDLKPQREVKLEYWIDELVKLARVGEILTDPANAKKNTLIVVENPEEVKNIASLLNNLEQIEYRILSAQNEKEDVELYNWISQKDENSEKRRILICVKMVGRGVDLRPDDKVQQEGFLLIATTPFTFERSYQQLLGRIGRVRTQGSAYILVSPEDRVFSSLSLKEKQRLLELITKRDKRKLDSLLRQAWDHWEGEITQLMKYWAYFSEPVEQVRLLFSKFTSNITSLDLNQGLLDKYSIDIKEFKEFLARSDKVKLIISQSWGEFIKFLEYSFNAWLAAGKLGYFKDEDQIRSVWTRFVFDEFNQRFGEEFIKKQNQELIEILINEFLDEISPVL